MSVSHRYRNFGGGKPSTKAPEGAANEALEDEKLQAFEAGYQAGWDDALKAKNDEKDKLRDELSQQLLDMSFTYQEALSKMTASMKPAIQQIIDKLLPELVQQSLAAHVAEQVENLINDHAPQKVEITVASENVAIVQDMIGDVLPEAFEIVGDDVVTKGQAFVRVDANEREVDLDTTIEKVSEALKAFFHEVTQVHTNDG